MTSDKTLIKRRFEAGFSRYDRLAVVQQQICEQLSEIVSRVCVKPGQASKTGRALEVGIGTGFLTRRLLQQFPDTTWFLNDIVEASQQFVNKYITAPQTEYLWGDAESVALPEKLNLICSASTVQWFDDLPRFIEKCALSSVNGGYLAITTFGNQNFHQIKSVTGEGLRYYTIDELTAILQNNNYHIVESIEYIKDLAFDTPTEVLKHIKATGVNSLKSTRWTKQNLSQFESDYRQLCPERIALTYHPIIIVAKLG